MAQVTQPRSHHNLQEFNQNAVVQDWQVAFHRGDLLNGLKKHWRDYVPVVYGSGNDPTKEERLAEKFLFSPMEAFLCEGNPSDILSRLREKERPSTLCGRVFKTGEPTYSCRDCANDPTCVLCIDCFEKSPHKKHRYRMSTSGGGGYCDCGDVEAWKKDPCCETHTAHPSHSEDQNPIDLLPVELTDRASMLFLATFQYCVDLLTWDQCEELPEGLALDPRYRQDLYSCMLFNDEVHTYDQVISTLQRAVDCTQREAVEFATIVDREGRSTVKQGTKADCDKAKEIIEKQTSRHNNKPLKVCVMHVSVVAHQQFALKLISWLQNLTSKAEGLRRLFCLLSMQPQDKNVTKLSLMERILMSDTKLWKVARVQCHQLLMSGALMDQECKKQFAILFTKHYATLMRDFIRDDHYRPVSITSISVQIFTVPTLARMLIAKHNLLEVILKAFLEPCQQKKKDGKLSFERSDRNAAFKRAWFMLADLKYALLAKPTSAEEWSEDLRTNFLNSFVVLLELLKLMQGMDAVTRQTGQHLEFEPEWEGAFNLQLKLDDSLVMFTEWCGSDRDALVEAYKETVAALYEVTEKAKKEKIEVLGHSTKVIKYDVSSQPVSIHLPLTRHIAALHLHLEKYEMDFRSPELMQSHKRVDPVDLIESPLRALVMIAQTHAGMWRRNGFSLLNQIFFYHNVRCRGQMYDKDILTMQIGASCIPNNDFLIHLLFKFSLLHWVKPEYDTPGGQEDSVRQTVFMAEEFLSLLIILIGERFLPGLGDVSKGDVVRREIIHQLCITPMAHSELVKALPEDPSHETGMESVVREVAEFKKPSGPNKGKYELRPEFYKDYNPFFYHYTKAEQSKSEEAQRKRKKQEGTEDQALPPPVPPPFRPPFTAITSLLQCDIMMHIFKIVLQRTAAQRSRSWSETQFERVLFLIGMALHEQVRAIQENNTSYDFLGKSIAKDPKSIRPRTRQVSLHKDGGDSLLSILTSLVGAPNLTQDPAKDLLSWVLKKFAEVGSLREGTVHAELEQLVPVTGKKSDTERKRKAEIAAKRRARLMAQMSKMQRNFIAGNVELFESSSSNLRSVGSEMDLTEEQEYPIALGPKRSGSKLPRVLTVKCILCQEDEEVTYNGKAMVLAALVQRSTVLSQDRRKHLADPNNHDPLFMSADIFTGTHTSSCGHVMHHECWQRHFDNVVNKERQRTSRFRQSFSFDVEKMEYLCPMCEGLSNTVIPMVPPLASLRGESGEGKDVELSFADWLDCLHKTVENSIKEDTEKSNDEESLLIQPCPITTITRMMADSVAKNFQLLWEYVHDDASGHFSEGMREMLKKLARDVYSVGLGVDPDDENPRVSIMCWNTCAYTIMVLEQCLRVEKKALFGPMPARQAELLGSLIRFAAVSSQVMSPDTIRRHCLRLLSVLMPGEVERHSGQVPSLLEIDMFHLLVALTMTLPTLFAETKSALSTLPSGGLNDLHALQLVLTAHLCQIMLTFSVSQSVEPMEEDGESTRGQQLLDVYTRIREGAGLKTEHLPSPWQLRKHVEQACLPFLRCSAILYHHLTGVNSPLELQGKCGHEFEALCRFLCLPSNLASLFNDHGRIMEELILSWGQSKAVQERLGAGADPVPEFPLPINHLQSLPEDYSELINQISTFTCPKSDGDDSRAPTMCLVCGKVLCSQSYCCQTEMDGFTVGAATEHAHYCGAGIGIFLRVRECQVLLLAGRTKGCFIAPPYLDDYGEADQGLRRGNPLHLSQERYEYLHRLWLSHSIPTSIAHNLESHSSFMTIEWHNL